MTEEHGPPNITPGREPAGAGALQWVRRAIVFADLVESVRLMQHHEAEVIARWRRFVNAVRERHMAQWGGRLVRTAGDGLLIECERPAGAVALALAMHADLAEGNAGRPPDAQMLLRVGIHVADVVFDEHEAYGAGVNLAHRLSQLAPPGGTLLSAEARDAVADGVLCNFTDLGPRYVKHLPEPVRAFAAHAPTGEAAPPLLPAAEDLRPRVAVIPFRALPADAAHDALGFAMADEIIATLARHPGLRVLSRMSTAAVRDFAGSTAQLRRTLDAGFALSGSFYVRGSRVRLAVELCELENGQVVWTGTHMADIDALFEGQDELVPQIVAQVAQQVMAHELVRVRSLPMDTLASYSLLLGASGLVNSLVPADFARARELLLHLGERHPRQAVLQAMLADWHVMRLVQGWSGDAAADASAAWQHANRALDLDPDSPDALVASAVSGVLRDGDAAGAEAACRRALAVNPQHAMAWAELSEAQRLQGDAHAGLASARRALEISPLDPQRFVFESFAAMAALEAGLLADAQHHARASLRRHAVHAPPHRVLVCALWLSGQEDAARSAAAAALQALPGMTVGGRVRSGSGSAFQSPYARALLAAGIPP